MGFKDLPGGSGAKQSQSAADKNSQQQAQATDDVSKKEETFTSMKSSQ